MPIKGVRAGLPRELNQTIIWDIDPRKTALLVVDMQECFCDPRGAFYVPQTAAIVPTINRLTDFCRKTGIQVVWIREQVGNFPNDWKPYHDLIPQAKEKNFGLRAGNSGVLLFRKLNRKHGDWEVVKSRYSPFASNNPSTPNLDRMLRSNCKDTVIITATNTNICCDNTARDAMNLDYKVIFVSDACCTYDNTLHDATLTSMKNFYAMVCTTDELIDEIQLQLRKRTKLPIAATQ